MFDKIFMSKPWIDFAAAVLSLVVMAAQLGSFAFGPETPTPPAVKDPVEVLQRMSTCGLPLSLHDVEFLHVFVPTILFTI